MSLQAVERTARLAQGTEVGLDDKAVHAVMSPPAAPTRRDNGVAVVEVVARLLLERDGPRLKVVQIAVKARATVL